MKRTFLTALCITSLFAGATHAVADDQSGENHYILCEKGAGCPAGFGGPAVAPPAYRIESLYSNHAGWFQYIELRQNSAESRDTSLVGSVITVRHGTDTKQFAIPSDPPSSFRAGGSLVISTIADWSDGIMLDTVIPPDYVMPAPFLPTDGGTIDLNGQDPWTYDALPRDGVTKLLRDGSTAAASGRSYALGDYTVQGEFEPAFEYYNAALDHYFVTASEPDIDAIGSGRTKGWQETGYSLGTLNVPIPKFCCDAARQWGGPTGQVAVPVCRFYIPPAFGDSHFFSAGAQECKEVAAKFPEFLLETDADFFVYLPDKDTGVCPFPFSPVYRLWNQRADTNHRYIADDLVLRGEMMAKGWLPEGFGPTGVAWCMGPPTG